VPMAFTKRGGRKFVISPDGVSSVASTTPANRQRHGKGAGAGVPLAQAVGVRRVRYG